MAGNQELMQAFQIWQDAIGQKNAQDALFQSTKLAEQIQSSNVDQYQKEQQLKGLGNNLAAFLAQQGQSGQAAALAANAISGGIPEKAGSIADVLINEEKYSPEKVSKVKSLYAQEQQHELDLQALKNKQRELDPVSSAIKTEAEQRRQDTLANTIQQQFSSQFVKKELEALKAADDLAMVSDPKQENLPTLKSVALGMLVQLGQGSAKVSDADIKLVEPSKSAARKLKQMYNEFLFNKTLPEDIADIRKVAELMSMSIKKRLKTKADQFAAARADIYPGGKDRLRVSLGALIGEDVELTPKESGQVNGTGTKPPIDVNQFIIKR